MLIEGISPDGVAYLAYTGTTTEQLAEQGLFMPASLGEFVHGTEQIMSLLAESIGQQVLLTPTGPAVAVALDNEPSLLAWFAQETEAHVDGGGEFIVDPAPPGDQVVY